LDGGYLFPDERLEKAPNTGHHRIRKLCEDRLTSIKNYIGSVWRATKAREKKRKKETFTSGHFHDKSRQQAEKAIHDQ